jgi:hypothetical protein
MTVLNLVKNDVKAELQNYLREKEINALFVSIVESLLLEKPEEPISFIFRFLAVRKNHQKHFRSILIPVKEADFY